MFSHDTHSQSDIFYLLIFVFFRFLALLPDIPCCTELSHILTLISRLTYPSPFQTLLGSTPDLRPGVFAVIPITFLKKTLIHLIILFNF